MSGSVSLINGHIDPDKDEMTPQEAINFIENEIQIDVRFCSDEEVSKTKEVLEFAISALEKLIPKRAIMKGFRPCEEICSISYICPVCKKHINIENYCYHCGQALDWSDTE